ncbi:hypothetical protein [Bifidobacterium primatium]|nr:hypothetical protein [Bifidobacterium primatium]
MDVFWNAVNAIGNLLIGIGTVIVGIAAYKGAGSDHGGKPEK